MFMILVTKEEFLSFRNSQDFGFAHKYCANQLNKYFKWHREKFFLRAGSRSGYYTFRAPVPVLLKVRGEKLYVRGFLLGCHTTGRALASSGWHPTEIFYRVTCNLDTVRARLKAAGIGLSEAKQAVGVDYNDL